MSGTRAPFCVGGSEPTGGPVQVFRLSEDHKPSRDDERQRIENAGGLVDLHGVWRVFCPEQTYFGGEIALNL